MTEPTPDTTPDPAAQPDGASKPQPTIEELQAQLDKVTAESRKWETRSKENLAAAKALEDQRKAAMTDAERVAAEAEERGRMAERSTWGARLARTQYEAEAARRNPSYDVASVLDDLNLAKFIGEDGEPDLKAIAASVARLVPEADGPRFGNADQGPRGGNSIPDFNQQLRRAAGRA